ncbi:MAG: hypothetical protein J2P17_29135 [Mycobacterium sp.]|nr:hypothetical protein [Mycobacterium sp.]
MGVDAGGEKHVIAQLPAIGMATELSLPGDGDYSDWLTASDRGFFVYDWQLWKGPYKRYAVPTVPIIGEQLPPPVREVAELVNLPSDFSAERTLTFPYVEPA